MSLSSPVATNNCVFSGNSPGTPLVTALAMDSETMSSTVSFSIGVLCTVGQIPGSLCISVAHNQTGKLVLPWAACLLVLGLIYSDLVLSAEDMSTVCSHPHEATRAHELPIHAFLPPLNISPSVAVLPGHEVHTRKAPAPEGTTTASRRQGWPDTSCQLPDNSGNNASCSAEVL